MTSTTPPITDQLLSQPAYSRRPEGVDLGNWRLSPYNHWSFHHVQDLIPSALIASSPTANPLVTGQSADLGQLTVESGESLETFLGQSSTDSFLVLHRGQKVWEWNAAHCDISRPHIVFSISKSITAMLAGIVADLGVIDVTQQVSHYLPGVKNSAYADCTVQHVLDMAVALDFNEEYLNADGDYNRYRKATCWNPVDQTTNPETLEPFLYTLGKADFEHGEQFNYKSPNSDLLGLLLERATGVYYADLMSQLLWQPMGAGYDGYVTVDRALLARGAGGISVHISDLARLGQLVMDGGTANGNTVIPASWIEDTMQNGDRAAWLKGTFKEMLPDGRYRNKWYQVGDADGCFLAIGIYGQWLYMNPATSVVIAKMSSQAEPVEDDTDVKWLKAFSQITRAF